MVDAMYIDDRGVGVVNEMDAMIAKAQSDGRTISYFMLSAEEKFWLQQAYVGGRLTGRDLLIDNGGPLQAWYRGIELRW